jgi:fatty acid desaturase
MENTIRLDRAEGPTATPARVKPDRVPDDVAMLRSAVELTRDIIAPRPVIYWSDFLASVAIGYPALFAAMMPGLGGWAIVAGIIAVLALYRAVSFIHEVAHIKHSAVPGFRLGYNILIGVPLLLPSFSYEGVHSIHHTRTRFGTAEDPEYLPLALMKPWSVPLFIGASLFAPIALVARFAVFAPLSLLSSRLRTMVVERFSTLAINPAFRRRPPEGELKTFWRWQEIGASLWAITLVALIVTGVFPLRAVAISLVITGGVALTNQVRTLVAHLWENDGDAITVTAQYLDSVNVPPPTLLPMLWAPVGLRYHAVHHLMPSMPYHSLGEAHRRLSKTLAPDSPFHNASHRGLPGLVGRLIGTTMRGKVAR